MIAAFPMYDRPETAGVYDRLWTQIRSVLPFEAPQQLSRGGDLMQDWLSPDLAVSQTCGFPYRAALHGHVQLVATPVWDLPCPAGHYFSVLVARVQDPRSEFAEFSDARLAFNEPLSQSGWAAPQTYAQEHGFLFRKHLQTGAHRASARAVAEGLADLAAIDAVTWSLMVRHDPWVKGLRVIAETPPTPTLPYVTANGRPVAAVRAALEAGVAALSDADRTAICLRGLINLSAELYLAVPTPPTPEAIASEMG